MPVQSCSDVRVLVYFGGAERETGVGGRGDVGVRRKERLELALRVQGRRGQQSGVDAHRDLMYDARGVGDAVGGLEDGAGGDGGGQEVGHGRSRDQGTRWRVGQQGGLGVRVAANVGVGACCVVGAAVGQGECVPVHCGRDIGLWSPVGEVSIPFLVAGAKMLHLQKRRAHCWSDILFIPARCLPQCSTRCCCLHIVRFNDVSFFYSLKQY